MGYLMPVRCYTHLNESSVAKSTRRSSGSARGLKSPSQVSSGPDAMVNCVGGVVVIIMVVVVILRWWAWNGGEKRDTDLIYGVQNI